MNDVSSKCVELKPEKQHIEGVCGWTESGQFSEPFIHPNSAGFCPLPNSNLNGFPMWSVTSPTNQANGLTTAHTVDGREGKGREGKGREGKGREGKGREGKGREGKGREGKGREGKGREGKGREGKGREGGREGGKEGRDPLLQVLEFRLCRFAASARPAFRFAAPRPAQCATPKAGEQALPSIIEDGVDRRMGRVRRDLDPPCVSQLKACPMW